MLEIRNGWWGNGLHKYRWDLMEFVTEIILLKSRELTSEGGIPLGELIFSREENDFGNILDATLLGDFPCECLLELLTARATCLDPGVGQILTTTVVLRVS